MVNAMTHYALLLHRPVLGSRETSQSSMSLGSLALFRAPLRRRTIDALIVDPQLMGIGSYEEQRRARRARRYRWPSTAIDSTKKGLNRCCLLVRDKIVESCRAVHVPRAQTFR